MGVFILFDFLFECGRIILLSFIYGTSLWVIIRIIRGKKFDRLREYIGLLAGVFLLLVINRNMPWRDEGSGDICRVPLPGKYELGICDCIDHGQIEKRDEKISGISIDRLYVKDHKIFARLDQGTFGTDTMEYVIVAIATDSISKFRDEVSFRKAGGELLRLKKPMELYNERWSKWRFFY